jgi:hypothetical protein
MGWVWSGGPNLAPGPLCSVAVDPDRHRGWLLCRSPVPPYRRLPAGGCGRACSRLIGLARSSKLAVYIPRHGHGALRATPRPLAKRKASSDRTSPQPSFSKPFLHLLARSCVLCRFGPVLLLQRKPGPRIALPEHQLLLRLRLFLTKVATAVIATQTPRLASVDLGLSF